MSEADKMFENLGYKKISENLEYIVYHNDEHLWTIQIDLKGKTLCIEERYLTLEELKAINKKCTEIGWI